MKFQVTLKDPDGFEDGIVDASKASVAAVGGLEPIEKGRLRDSRRNDLYEHLKKWVEHGEYITVEFDTVAGTATVVPVGK